MITVNSKRSFRLVAKTLAIGVLFSSLSYGSAARAEESYRLQGEALARQGSWSDAERNFNLAVQQYPDDAVAYYDLAIAQARLGDLNKARESIEKALRLDPRYVPSYIQKAAVCSRLRDVENAKSALIKALELDPKNTLVLKNLKALEEESPKIQKNQEKVPVKSPAINNQVAHKGNCEVCAPVARALVSRAALLVKQGKIDTAERFVQQAINADPTCSSAHASRATLLGMLGRFEDQVKEAEKAVEMNGNTANLFALAWAQGAIGQWSQALETYQQVLKQEPNLVQAQVGQALCLCFTGKQEVGLAALKELSLTHTDDAMAYCGLGAALMQAERPEEAAESLNKALAINPRYPDALERLAALKLEQRDFKQAAELYGRLHELRAASVDTLIGKGFAHLESGDATLASAEFKRATELDARNGAAHMGMGLALQKKGLTRESNLELEKAKELDPDLKQLLSARGTLAQKDGAI